MIRTTCLNIRHLRAFCEVAETGAISSAAPRIQLSQPAVTQAIAKLEDLFQTELFVRSAGGMELTDAGAILRPRVVRMLGQLRQAGAGAVAKFGGKGPKTHLDHVATAAQLRAVLAVADQGSFTLAARSLEVSQPSLQRMARDLEKLVGVEIYQRVPQGLTLNPVGLELARRIKLSYVELRQGIEELLRLSDRGGSDLRIGYLAEAQGPLIVRTLLQAREAAPSLQIKGVEASQADLMTQLRSGDLDVIIGPLPSGTDDPELARLEVKTEALAFVARAGHPLAETSSLDWSDLEAGPWILPVEGSPIRQALTHWCTEAGRSEPMPDFEATAPGLIRALLSASDSVSLLPRHLISEDGSDPGPLCVLTCEAPASERALGVLYRRDWHPTADQASFLDEVRKWASTL